MAACAAVAAEQRHRRSPAALPPGPQGFAAERRPRNMDVAIRCTKPGCGCDCFTPSKAAHRLCGSCQHGWVAHALDKLGQRRHLQGSGCGGTMVVGTAPELVQASSAFDMASLVLYGSHAVPVRLKILLDRLLSVLPHDDVIHVLHGFGWTYEDYVRGYILQDSHGTVLERWSLASREEEPQIIQQFLRFGETRTLAHHFLRSDGLLGGIDRNLADGALHPDSDIRKFLERTSRSNAVTSSVIPSGNKFGNASETVLGCGGMLLNRPSLRAPPQPPSSVSSGQSASPPAARCSPAASPLAAISSSSPLNKLQNMQPYDFRHAEHKGSSPEIVKAVTEGLRTADMLLMHNQQHNHNSTPLSSPTHTNNMAASFLNHSSDLSMTDGASDEDTVDGGAINLTLGGGLGSMDSVFAARKVKHLRKSANPMKRRWNPMVLSTLTTSPATGKRRVQCHVCLKTFCDKGALKIHFSAVHLREMHKCTVEGCNMMFSSRRSRNRHSANPNPKLHTPNLRRKISPHDGRTANPFPLLPPSTLLNFNNANTTGLVSPASLTPSLHEKIGSMQEKLASLCPTPPMPPSNLSMQVDCALSLTKKLKVEERFVSDGREARRSPDKREESVNLSLGKETKNQENKTGIPSLNDNKGVRKRKALNPTKVAAIISDDDLQFATSDESSSNTYIDQNGLLEESKSDDDDDVDDITTDGQEDDSKDFDVDDDLDDKDTDGRATPSPPLIKFKSEREVPKWNFEVEQNKLSGIKHEDQKPEIQSSSKSRILPEKKDSVEDLSVTKREDGKTTPPTRVKTEDMAENPLRHLESLSLGAFAGLVPTTPRSLAGGGVSFHAPGLGLADVPREALVNSSGLHEPSMLGRDSPPSSEQHMSSLLPVYRDAALVGPGLEIPVDKEDPRRCTACGKVFQNHFGVRTHYQNVHLKLMHKCTVEGCNAAFPSRRSRDRHSANLNLHRRLLSTTSSDKGASPFLDKALFPYPPSEFFTRLYDPQGLPLNLADVYHRLPAPEGFVLPPAFAVSPFHHHHPAGLLGLPGSATDSRPSDGSRGGSPASATSSSPGPRSPQDLRHDEDEDSRDKDERSSPPSSSKNARTPPVEDVPVAVAAT